jgi:hypothetical protein
MQRPIALPENASVSIQGLFFAYWGEMINFSKDYQEKERQTRMGAIIQTIRAMTVGGKLALVLSCLWVFGLTACSGGGGCIPGGGGKLPPPPPPRPQPRTQMIKVTLQRDRINMPHVIPPGPTLLRVTNQDNLAHYLEIERQGTEIMYGLDLVPGDTKELKIFLESGRYRLWYPFHRGKTGTVQLVVTVTPAPAPAYPY